jgi:fructokinase
VTTAVADTIGAGDSYMAALILGLLSRSTAGLAPAVLETIGRTASAAAAITVSRPGANPPTLDELRAAVDAAAQDHKSQDVAAIGV